MKRKNLLLTMTLLTSVVLLAQVGIGNDTPKGILDLTNTTSDSKTYPLVLPVATEDIVEAPPSKNLTVGSVFYDTNDLCLKIYDGDQWKCLGAVNTIAEGERSGTCGTYYQATALKSTLSPNEKIGVVILKESLLPQSSLSVDQVVIEGSNGEVITIQNTNYSGPIVEGDGFTVEEIMEEGQYAISLQITNPSVVNTSSVKFTYDPPFGGIKGMPVDECGYNLY